MKKTICIMLAALLLALSFPVCVNAESDIVYGHKGDIVYFDNSTACLSKVYCYLWDKGGEMQWPGEQMSYCGNNIWSYTLKDDYCMLIFSGDGYQTGDLMYPGNNKVAKPRGQLQQVNWVDFSSDMTIEPPMLGKLGDTIYFDNTYVQATDVFCFCWKGGDYKTCSWEKMDYVGKNIRAYTLKEECRYIIFKYDVFLSEALTFPGNNKLAIPHNGTESIEWIDFNFSVVKYASGRIGDSIYYDNSRTNFDEVYCYTWFTDSAGVNHENSGWPGEKMNYLGNDIWSYTLKKDCDKIIFEGTGNHQQQSEDLLFPGDGKIAVGEFTEPFSAPGPYGKYTLKISWNNYNVNNDNTFTERIVIGTKTNYYGAANYDLSKAGEVQDAAIDFKEKLESYYNAFVSEGQKKIGNTNSLISLDELAKQLRRQDEAASDKYITMIDSNVPSDCLDSIYYALADFLTNVVNNKVDLGSIDFSKDSISNAAKIVNAVKNGMRGSGKNTIRKGNYEITLNTQNMWGSFAGTVTAKKVSGFNSGSTYTGEIDSTMAGTKKVLATYMDCMSDIVKDACKYALFSTLSEFKNVTGIAQFEKTQLENFFSDKVDILQKNGFGDVLGLFLNTRTGYKAVKPILNANNGGSLKIALNNAQRIYDSVNELEFSSQGINKKAVKEAVKEVEKARKKLANKLFSYIYNTDEPLEEDEGFFGWIKTVFGIQCPVEFEVYDNSGKLIGYVDSSDKHENYIWFTDDIYIEVDGDSKFVYAPVDMELNFIFTAIDDGAMNYTIERQNGRESIERLNYFDVPLVSGESYAQSIPANIKLNETPELPLVGDTDINYDQYLGAEDLSGHIDVICEAENGTVIGDGAYPVGDLVKLVALENDEYIFKGWSVDDAIVETSEIYRFTAKEDITVKAIYEKRMEPDYSYTATYTDDYAEGFVELIKQPDNKRDVHIAMPTDKMDSFSLTRINLYDNIGELISSDTFSGETTSENDILIADLSLDNVSKITINDSNNHLVATLAKADSLTLQQIIPDKEKISLKANETAQINVFPVPIKSSLSGLCWESLNPEIAQVDENGVVTGLLPGKTIIRCFTLNGEISCESVINVCADVGDTNLDGIVSINDVTAVQRWLVELETFSDEQIALADANGDGEINISDATYLQMVLAQ